MSDTRDINVSVLGSLASGLPLLVGDIHLSEIASFLTGRTIKPRDLMNDDLWDELRSIVMEQYPDLLQRIADIHSDEWYSATLPITARQHNT